MNDLFFNWLLEIGKEAAMILMPEILDMFLNKKVPDNKDAIYTKFLEAIVNSDLTTEARKKVQRKLMPGAEIILKHHKAAV